MTDRNMSAAMLAEVAKDQVSPCYLCSFNFDSGELNMTDASIDVTALSKTFLKTNGFLSFSDITEVGVPQVHTVRFQLSGVDTSAAMAKVLNDDFLDRECFIWLAFIDANGDVVADPLKIFEGRMDAPQIVDNPDDGSSTVSVTGTSQWQDFGRRPGRHTNSNEQQFYFSGDLGFDFVSEIPKIIDWGRT